MNNGILVDIDTIVDVRLALVYLINSNLVKKILENDSYIDRLRDNMGEMSSNIFRSFYLRRNKKILELAIPTLVTEKFIRDDCYNKVSTVRNYHTGCIKIFINTYPYNLNENEKKLFKDMISNLLYGGEIEFIHKSIPDLTPAWVSENVTSIYMYNGLDWMNYHMSCNNLVRNPLPSTLLVVPTIVDSSVPLNIIDDNFFKTIEDSSKPFISLSFIDTIYFCAKNIKLEDKNKE